jgi:glycosyltransferase involved in cell wall biosynthesis
VVPSLWWENSPITIHEAFLAGVPVVASDQGGMAELVQDGVNGFLFRMGDAADLARALMRFVSDPSLVERLRPRREAIRDIREDALATEAHYRRLIREKASAP